jgi:RNA polymerase sigma-70 factor (ECF subfamily)
LVRLPDANALPSVDDAAWFEGEDLRRAVMHLPHDQRVAILLHFHLDMPLRDVAIALGLTQSGVKTRINRALKRLRPAMGVSEVRVNG